MSVKTLPFGIVTVLTLVALYSVSAQVSLVGNYDTPGSAYRIEISGQIAYIADRRSGLRIVDISDPTSPTLIGSYDTPGDATGVAISGNTVYVADGIHGLHIIDISDPPSPSLIGSYNTPTGTKDVTVAGNFAFVANAASGLQIIDISNPTAPLSVGCYNTPDPTVSATVFGAYAYVADKTSGLLIIGISDPMHPSLIGSYDTPGSAQDVVVVGNYAYVADYESGLQIIDISNPATPSYVTHYDTPGKASQVAVNGQYAYVADRTSGLQILDVSDPASPTLAGSYDTSGDGWGVAVEENYIYVADGTDGMPILEFDIISSVSFFQLDFNLEGTITENSRWGVARLEYLGSDSIQYFNLTVNGEWKVRNAPVLSVDGGGLVQAQNFWFDLGNDVGTDITSLGYAFDLSIVVLDTLLTEETVDTVENREIEFYCGIDDTFTVPTIPPATVAVDPIPLLSPPLSHHANGGVPNQEQGINECCPAAISNSLQWLNRVHELGLDPGTIDIETMKEACGWTPVGAPSTWPTLKDDYMQAHGYPITTREFSKDNIDRVAEEMDRDQDVEMTIYNHAMTVVGLTEFADGKWIVTFKHDLLQGREGGCETQSSTFDPSTGMFVDGALAGFELRKFVVECPTFEGEKVGVTFIANTATVPDTLDHSSFVQIRGSGESLAWDVNSPAILQNMGTEENPSDYWIWTGEFEEGEKVDYRIFTNTHEDITPGSEWEDQGWECDVNTPHGCGHRRLTVGSEDTVLHLQFVNGQKECLDQYFRPWEDEEGSFVVWVRVNMQCWEGFNPQCHIIGLRGSNTEDWGQTGEISWGCTYPLIQEADHCNQSSRLYPGKYFYSAPIHVPDEYAGAAIEFKVVVHTVGADLCEGWDKLVYNPTLQTHADLSGVDTTLHWFWFDNCPPREISHEDYVVVHWEADMSTAIQECGFIFDGNLEVRSGYFGTADKMHSKLMTRRGLTNVYCATDTLIATIGGHLYYQYYLVVDCVDNRELFFNFEFESDIHEAERRIQDPIPGSELTIYDTIDSEYRIHRRPKFCCLSTLTQDVTVTYTCDVRPAICHVAAGGVLMDLHGDIDITDTDQVIDLGVAMNGPATESGWTDWGPQLMQLESKRMWDDGTHGDELAGDSIYIRREIYTVAEGDVVCQEFRFGIGGGDNEGGYINHIVNIDGSQSTFTLHSQFGSIAPYDYAPWNFETETCQGVMKCDVNGDGRLDIVDIIEMVHCFLYIVPCPPEPGTPEFYVQDCNGDGEINVLDVLGCVNVLLGIGECDPLGSKE